MYWSITTVKNIQKVKRGKIYVVENHEWHCSIENNATCTWLALNMKKSATREYMVHTR